VSCTIFHPHNFAGRNLRLGSDFVGKNPGMFLLETFFPLIRYDYYWQHGISAKKKFLIR
jgi:hypothetical protein